MQEFIHIIKTGSKQEAKSAIKKVEDLWHGILNRNTETEKKKLKVFVDEIQNFEQIPNLENQIYFIDSLRTPVLVLGDKYFQTFCNFILKYIEHPSGKIRQAILRLSSWFAMIGLESVNGEACYGKKLSEEEIKLMKRNRELYFALVQNAENLMEKHYDRKFDKCKYIDALPASVYKSLEYLISNELLRVTRYELLYQEYLNKKRGYETPKEIIARRTEIESELAELLETLNSDFDLDDIKEIIYNEEDSEDMQDVIRMFDDGNVENISNALEVVADAWNYFPHKCLDGLCPQEKLIGL